MPYTDNAKNGMLGQLRGRITALSLHSANPGTTGTGEISGGGYSRATVSASDFASPSAGAFTLTVAQEFAATPAQSITHFGVWDGSTFLGSGPITGDNAANSEGEFLLQVGTSFDLNA